MSLLCTFLIGQVPPAVRRRRRYAMFTLLASIPPPPAASPPPAAAASAAAAADTPPTSTGPPNPMRKAPENAFSPLLSLLQSNPNSPPEHSKGRKKETPEIILFPRVCVCFTPIYRPILRAQCRRRLRSSLLSPLVRPIAASRRSLKKNWIDREGGKSGQLRSANGPKS